jgi:hypothetical protein
MEETTMSITQRATSVLIAAVFILAVASPLYAGVVFQLKTTYHSGSGARVQDSKMSVQGQFLKMEILQGKQKSGGDVKDEMVFRGDRKQMVAISHQDKSYMIIDAKTIKEMSKKMPAAPGGDAQAQMQEAMKDLEEKMAELDPKQREMVEKMMKEKMGYGATMGSKPSPREFVRTKEQATKQGYPCVRYDVTRDGEKISELWVTDWDNIRGIKQTVGVFEEMAAFHRELLDSFKWMAGGATGFFAAEQDPIEDFTRVDGFPVVTRTFEGGELESETVLESVAEKDLNPDAFEPPKGYKLQTIGPH